MNLILEKMLLYAAAFNHVRFFALPGLPVVYFTTFLGVFWFLVSFKWIVPIHYFMFLVYLLFFILIGLANLNPLIFILKDTLNVMAAFGFFCWGYSKYKNDFTTLVMGMKVISTTTVNLFLFLWIILIFVKFLGSDFYFQVQMDLLPVLLYYLYFNNMKFGLIRVLTLAFLSNKRMMLLATLASFLLRSLFHFKTLISISLFIVIFLLASISFPNNFFSAKYLETIRSLADLIILEDVFFSILKFDPYRQAEVLYLIENYSMNFLGGGAGYGVVTVTNNSGILSTNSFIHVSLLSIAYKIGYLGISLVSLFFIYLFINVSSKARIIILTMLVFCSVASIFAAYIISSWIFWYSLGAFFGVFKEVKNSKLS